MTKKTTAFERADSHRPPATLDHYNDAFDAGDGLYVAAARAVAVFEIVVGGPGSA